MGVSVAPGATAHAVQINDALNSALILSGASDSIAVTGNEDTSLQAGEPAPVCQSNYGSTVWFRWQPPTTGVATARTFNTLDTSLDTVLDVFEATSATTAALQWRACDDDGGAGLKSTAVFAVDNTKTYYLRVSGFGGAEGGFGISVDTDSCATAGPIYVDINAGEERDGTSWATPLNNLEMATLAVNTCLTSPIEIWVANGTYQPGPGVERFLLRNHAQLLGGFQGDETARSQADPAANLTVLSGDLNNNDVVTDASTFTDNLAIVVDSQGWNGHLDGVTIRGATQHALRTGFSNSTISRTRVTNNRTEYSTVGLFFSDQRLINVEIVDNVTTSASPDDAVPLIIDGQSTDIMNLTLARNDSPAAWASILIFGADVRMWSSTLAHNSLDGGATAAIAARSDGGAGTSMLEVHNTIMHESGDVAVSLEGGSTATISHSDIPAWAGAGSNNVTIDPKFVSTADLRLRPESPVRGIGNNNEGLIDSFDLDGDSNTGELTPDLDLNDRISNGNIDLGAYEGQGADLCAHDDQIFVDADANGTADGSSWVNAFNLLDDALDIHGLCDGPDEIWVAEGMYLPPGSGPFTLSAGVQVLGGFAGTETSAAQANPDAHATVLSGDLLGNDTSDPATASDNAGTVVSMLPGGVGTRLDGVTVTGGISFLLGASGADHTVSRSRFLGGQRQAANQIAIGGSGDFELIDVEISGTNNSGSALYLYGGSTTTVMNSTIVDNFSEAFAVVAVDNSSTLNLWSSTIAGNTVDTTAATIELNNSTLNVRNSIVWGNTTTGSIDAGAGSTQSVGTSIIEGEVTALDVDPDFVSPGLGNYTLAAGSPAVDIGDNTQGLTDIYDFDNDANTTELAPDLLGADRIFNGRIDLGAFERTILPDGDNDGVPDLTDNCPAVPNPTQTDLDGDDIGDACDPLIDSDNDGVGDDVDNCVLVPNADQVDTDGDGTGNVCDPTPDLDPVFVPLTPARYADTRGEPTFDDTHDDHGLVAGGTSYAIQIAGRGSVPSDASAAVINLTATGATGPGFATAYPCGDVPKASSINFGIGGTEPNEVIAKLSDTGMVCVFARTGVHLIVDVVGYAPANSPYVALTPARYADTRGEQTFDNTHDDHGLVASNTTYEIQIAGRGDVPADATAAVINLTVTGATGPGFATAYPCGTVPKASSINYDQTTTRPNELVTKLSPEGAVCVFAKTGVQVIVDVVGYIPTTPGYTPLTPARYADTRGEQTFDNTHDDHGLVASNTTYEIQIAGRGDVPADATAAVINLTVTGATGPGFATAYPCGTVPKASSINYDQTTTRPNELIAKLSADGSICVFAKTGVQLIIDVVGYLS